MNSNVNPHAILRWTLHHMVYIGGIVQSVSAQLWNIHSTIFTLKIIYLTFSVWAMLLADSFKHLAVEIPDHGWSVYRQMRAANSLLMTTVIQNTLFWGKCPTACSSRSPSCSGPTRWKLLCQCHGIRYLLHYSLWMSCACVRLQLEATVKLGYSVLGLARTLGYNVLSVDHEHRQSENMYIFFG